MILPYLHRLKTHIIVFLEPEHKASLHILVKCGVNLKEYGRSLFIFSKAIKSRLLLFLQFDLHSGFLFVDCIFWSDFYPK